MKHSEISENVIKMYGIYRSEDVVGSVLDYCVDLQLKLNYENFKSICHSVKFSKGVMMPTIKSMKNAVQILSQEVK